MDPGRMSPFVDRPLRRGPGVDRARSALLVARGMPGERVGRLGIAGEPITHSKVFGRRTFSSDGIPGKPEMIG